MSPETLLGPENRNRKKLSTLLRRGRELRDRPRSVDHLADDLKLFAGDGLDRESHTPLDDGHIPQFRMTLQLVEGYDAGEFLFERDIDHIPDGVIFFMARIEIFGIGIQCGMIRITFTDNRGDSRNTRGFGVAVIEEGLVSALDLVPQKVAGLVIADAFPAGGPVPLEVIDGIHNRFTFHQPVVDLFYHNLMISSLKILSTRREVA